MIVISPQILSLTPKKVHTRSRGGQTVSIENLTRIILPLLLFPGHDCESTEDLGREWAPIVFSSINLKKKSRLRSSVGMKR